MRRSGQWTQMLVLEDDGATSGRRRLAAVGGGLTQRVTMRVHEVRNGKGRIVAEESYRAGSMLKHGRGGKAAFALGLLDDIPTKSGAVVIAGSSYGSNGDFLTGLRTRGFAFIAEVRASELTARQPRRRGTEQLLRSAAWETVSVTSPTTGNAIKFSAAHLVAASPHLSVEGHLFAAQTGGIPGIHRGTILGFASDRGDIEDMVGAVVWARWIRPAVRKRARDEGAPVVRATSAVAAKDACITVRANIALSGRQDARVEAPDGANVQLRGRLGGRARLLNVVELFAGAGGMGLGFLLASKGRGGYRVTFSGEVNPIYTTTLNANHLRFSEQTGKHSRVPLETIPVDLRSPAMRNHIATSVRRAGGVDVLIGGPPCQGFSNANRNSWSRQNPNNRLVEVFLAYVEALLPPVFVMENVQGILWTSRAGRSDGSVSVVDHLARRMRGAGYAVYPRLLDAAWYGAPQYRSRFFLVGIHRDLGYHADDLGPWGPFPRPRFGPAGARPYVTVSEAIGDLPVLRNGGGATEADYVEPDTKQRRENEFLAYAREGAAVGTIHDHVTSRHADYVIDRYRRIPQGGNWEDIVDSMSNYADVGRTHSNIYRRLTWGDPAITIGHYRKSMLVHPSQHRGLSLREAARLQSFPDWFRFAGRVDGAEGGLVHQQQQLANAVCPLVTKALAEFLLAV